MRLILGLLLTLAACDDGEPAKRGRVSEGPPPDPGLVVGDSAAFGPRRRFVLDTGSALDTMRATHKVRARLKPLGVPEAAAQVVGDAVQVDVPEDKATEAKAALEGGRLDLWLADGADVFDPEDDGERFKVESEAVGEATVHFLRAPADQKDVLAAYVSEHAQGKEPLVGSVYDKGKLIGYRSYLAQPDHMARGEYLASAKVENGELVLGFEASGMSFIHWTSKQHERLLVRVDGDVIGAVQMRELIKNGVIRVPFPARASAGETEKAARVLAAKLDKGALGHATKLVEEKALNGP